MNQTSEGKIFQGKSAAYCAGRPGYSPAAVEEVFKLYPKAETFADIGSGTGIFSGQLLERGAEVFGVEPSVEMRLAAEKSLAAYPKFHSVTGTCDHTGLNEKSVDVVTAAQSFPWFDKSAFKAECERILKSDFNVVLLWNRKEEDQPIMRETRKVYLKYCPAFTGHSGGELSCVEAGIDAFFESKAARSVFANDLRFDEERFVNMQLSQSYAPTRESRDFAAFSAQMREIFSKFCVNGEVVIGNSTYLYRRGTAEDCAG